MKSIERFILWVIACTIFLFAFLGYYHEVFGATIARYEKAGDFVCSVMLDGNKDDKL